MLVRAQGGKTPVPSEHPSRGPDTFEQRLVSGRLTVREKVQFSNCIAIDTIKALRRCGFRCPITGLMDRLSSRRPEGMIRVTLEAAHIIPHSLSEAKTELDREQKRKVWKAIGIFAGEEIRMKLDGQKIDSLDNIIILEHNNHVAFGKLNLWFTQDEVFLNNF